MVRLYTCDVVIYLYYLVSFIFVSFTPPPPQTPVGQELRVCFVTKENDLWIDVL